MRIGKKEQEDKPDGRKALEEEIDAMLDPKRPDPTAGKASGLPANDSKASAQPKVSAVSAPAGAARTAPTLSDDLKKRAGISDADTKPLSIDKLDEITDKISKGDQKKNSKKDEPDSKAEGAAAEAAESTQDAVDAENTPSARDLDDGTTDLDDARTEEAVEDIVSHEGDVMLAVEDATRKQRNPELAGSKTKHKKGGRGVLATIMWTLVAFVAIVAILFLVLLITGESVTAR